MSQNQHSVDLNSDEFRRTWEEMEKIEPLTPISSTSDDYMKTYIEAAESDDYFFGDISIEDYYKVYEDNT